MLLRKALLFTVMLYSAGKLLAQNATMTGIVTDDAKAVVPGVAIHVRNIDTNIPRSLMTDGTGSYTITNLPPGHYELAAEMSGFKSYRQSGITLEIGQTLRADIQLALGNVVESVQVTAEVARLNTENGAVKG